MATPLDDLLRIDALADEFEGCWRRGERPSIAEHVGRLPLASRSHAVSELVIVDAQCRRRRGETPSFDDYRREFPGDLSISIAGFTGDARATSFVEPLPPSAPVGDFQRIGRYVVLSRMKSEGQADVYLAVHPLGVNVVLKFLRADLPRGLEKVITEEARLLAQLRHPRIAYVLDLDRHEGRAFAAIGYIPGQTLEQHCREQPLTPRQAAVLVADLARTLEAAHQLGIAHLDIKPRNVIVDADGRAHLIDFGTARTYTAARDDREAEDFISGTAPFMAPEQAEGVSSCIDRRADIFGLGALLYYLLSGKAPFAAPSAFESLLRSRRGEYDPLPPAVPRRLRRLCEAALQRRPDRRLASAALLAQKLEQFATPMISRRRVAIAATVGAAVLVAGILLPVLLSTRRAAPVLDSVYLRDHDRWESVEALSVHSAGAPLRFLAHAPPREHAAMFAVDTNGRVTRLTTRSTSDADRSLALPPEKSLMPEDSPGTRLFLVLSAGRALPGVEDVKALLAQAGLPLPLMPAGEVIRADSASPSKPIYPMATKGYTLQNDDSPDSAARAFVDRLRQGAIAKGFGFAAMAAGFSEP